jgi:L-ascorbate metabolism protein UlaG (beta-lactamase superfamily)
VRNPLGRPSLEPYDTYRQRSGVPAGGLTANFLGTSSLLLSDGTTTLLCDGFVTRPGLLRVGLGRISPDAGLVRAAIGRLEVRTLAAVFCAHSHYDHALDAPVWCLQTGAELVGSESTANIGRGLGLAESSLRVVGDGDTLEYGQFTLTFLDSVHSPGDRYPGVVQRPLVPPARTRAWKTGTAYSVLIEHPDGRILMHASANHRPGMLEGRSADVVYLGVGGLGKQSRDFVHRYWDDVVGTLGPRRIFPVHWDDFFLGLDQPLRPLPYFADRFDATMELLLPLAQRDDVEVVLPIAWEPTDPFGPLR